MLRTRLVAPQSVGIRQIRTRLDRVVLPCERMSTFDERRRARADWPIRKVGLREEGLTDERDVTTVDERIALVWTLTRRQWAFAGRPRPEYTRASMPGQLLRPSR